MSDNFKDLENNAKDAAQKLKKTAKEVAEEFSSIPESLLQLLNKIGNNKTKIKSLFEVIMSLI